MSVLWTLGHGTAGRATITSLLRDADIELVVDIRSAPGSRHNPDVAHSALDEWLPQDGIGYRWDRRLGGFRKALPNSPDYGLRNAAFRAYAAHMRTTEFLNGVKDLLLEMDETSVAVMCSESVWWRCHRRLVADYVSLIARRNVVHLMHDNRHIDHTPTAQARQQGDGLLVYDQVDQ